MKSRSTRGIAFIVLCLAVFTAVPATGALGDVGAGVADGPTHCIYDVVGYERDGVTFVLEETPECFASYADLLESRGVTRASGYSPTTVDRGTLAAAGIIATHYDIDTGSSISISGGPCNGGGLTLSADWKNRIDATASVCYVQGGVSSFV